MPGLDQYPTPAWVAECLVRENLADLDRHDVVCDPTCGPGRFLQAVPHYVQAFGIEIAPNLAQTARDLTGRLVLTGDFFATELPARPTVFLGNPPFQLSLVDRLLDRAHSLLDAEGRVALVLPAYAFQTAKRVVRYSESWSLQQQMIPRNIYHGLSKPLVFAIFRKDKRRVMLGFSLYHETAFVQSLPADVQDQLREGPATWEQLVVNAIRENGGEASLPAIYEYVCSRRPTANPNWKAQVRKICQVKGQRLSRGCYTHARAA
jgi:hypothetical protein